MIQKKCVKCNKKAELFLPTFTSCRSCFVKIIEKRVRKEFRVNEFLKKKDKIFLIDDGSPEAKLNIYFIKNLSQNLFLNLIILKAEEYSLGKTFKKNIKKIIIPWNSDKEALYFLESVLDNKNAEYLGHFLIKGNLFFKPLLHVSNNEILLFARIKNIKLSPKAFLKKETSYLSEHLELLENEFPEVKFSLIKSSQDIKNKLKNKNK